MALAMWKTCQQCACRLLVWIHRPLKDGPYFEKKQEENPFHPYTLKGLMGPAKGGRLHAEELDLLGFVNDRCDPLGLLDDLFFRDKILLFPLVQMLLQEHRLPKKCAGCIRKCSPRKTGLDRGDFVSLSSFPRF